ncbi:hypothetical protein Syun_016044 [Stephania yunnanensis]|uniref:Uncharacterized protein n=1 Tax=Stephania yunnanensis TaxID=152371 RepID=A0AAP0J6N7_9MAGN
MEPLDLSLIEIGGSDDSLIEQDLNIKSIRSDDLLNVVDAAGANHNFECSPLQTLGFKRSSARRPAPAIEMSNVDADDIGAVSGSVEGVVDKENVDEKKNLSAENSKKQMKMRRKVKGYNLRKSLAWNSAFFTEEGVLDSSELSTLCDKSIRESKKKTSTLSSISEETSAPLPKSGDTSLRKPSNEVRRLAGALSRKAGTASQKTAASTPSKVQTGKGTRIGSNGRGCPRPPASSSYPCYWKVWFINCVCHITKQGKSFLPAPVPTNSKLSQASKRNDTAGKKVLNPALPGDKPAPRNVTGSSGIVESTAPNNNERGRNIQTVQIQVAKPTGLRMPSPSLGFFDQKKASASPGILSPRPRGAHSSNLGDHDNPTFQKLNTPSRNSETKRVTAGTMRLPREGTDSTKHRVVASKDRIPSNITSPSNVVMKLNLEPNSLLTKLRSDFNPSANNQTHTQQGSQVILENFAGLDEKQMEVSNPTWDELDHISKDENKALAQSGSSPQDHYNSHLETSEVTDLQGSSSTRNESDFLRVECQVNSEMPLKRVDSLLGHKEYTVMESISTDNHDDISRAETREFSLHDVNEAKHLQKVSNAPSQMNSQMHASEEGILMESDHGIGIQTGILICNSVGNEDVVAAHLMSAINQAGLKTVVPGDHCCRVSCDTDGESEQQAELINPQNGSEKILFEHSPGNLISTQEDREAKGRSLQDSDAIALLDPVVQLKESYSGGQRGMDTQIEALHSLHDHLSYENHDINFEHIETSSDEVVQILSKCDPELLRHDMILLNEGIYSEQYTHEDNSNLSFVQSSTPELPKDDSFDNATNDMECYEEESTLRPIKDQIAADNRSEEDHMLTKIVGNDISPSCKNSNGSSNEGNCSKSIHKRKSMDGLMPDARAMKPKLNDLPHDELLAAHEEAEGEKRASASPTIRSPRDSNMGPNNLLIKLKSDSDPSTSDDQTFIQQDSEVIQDDSVELDEKQMEVRSPNRDGFDHMSHDERDWQRRTVNSETQVERVDNSIESRNGEDIVIDSLSVDNHDSILEISQDGDRQSGQAESREGALHDVNETKDEHEVSHALSQMSSEMHSSKAGKESRVDIGFLTCNVVGNNNVVSELHFSEAVNHVGSEVLASHGNCFRGSCDTDGASEQQAELGYPSNESEVVLFEDVHEEQNENVSVKQKGPIDESWEEIGFRNLVSTQENKDANGRLMQGSDVSALSSPALHLEGSDRGEYIRMEDNQMEAQMQFNSFDMLDEKLNSSVPNAGLGVLVNTSLVEVEQILFTCNHELQKHDEMMINDDRYCEPSQEDNVGIQSSTCEQLPEDHSLENVTNSSSERRVFSAAGEDDSFMHSHTVNMCLNSSSNNPPIENHETTKDELFEHLFSESYEAESSFISRSDQTVADNGSEENYKSSKITGSDLSPSSKSSNSGSPMRGNCSKSINKRKSLDDVKPDGRAMKPKLNAVPFSEEWLAALEAAGEDILTMKSGAVQNSPPEKSTSEPNPWSPVKRKNNEEIGPFHCTKYTTLLQPPQ